MAVPSLILRIQKHRLPQIWQQMCLGLSRDKTPDSAWLRISARSAHSAPANALKVTEVTSHNAVYKTAYMDEGPRDGPTAVALHGTPGGAQDFDDLSKLLVKDGIRFVAVNFPGNPLTQVISGQSSFDHSTASQGKFAKDFIKALGINNIAVMMGHSSGAYACVELGADLDGVKSIAIFNGPGTRPHRGLGPMWRLKTYTKFLAMPITEPIFKWPLPYLYGTRGFKENDADQLKFSLITARYLGFEAMARCGPLVRAKKLPVLFAFTQNDRLIEPEISTETAHLYGIPDEGFTYFDAGKRVVRGPDLKAEPLLRRALVFERGGHVVYKAYRDVIHTALMQLIEQSSQSRASS